MRNANGSLTPEKGYQWVYPNRPWNHDVEPIPGTPGPCDHCVWEKGWQVRVLSGWRFAGDTEGDLRTEADPAYIHHDSGKLEPARGYVWASDNPKTLSVDFDPLLIHEHRGLVRPAFGNRWISANPAADRDYRVTLAPVKARTAELVDIVEAYQRKARFQSPLSDPVIAEAIIRITDQTGVPLWLLMAQATRETSLGNPKNATTRDGVTFTDGTQGHAHNLFNIRPTPDWTGKVINTGRGGKFRGYASYEDSLRDYCRLMTNFYRGLSLEKLAYKYFPPSDNNGRHATEDYIRFITRYASEVMRVTVKRDSVPIQ